MFGYAPSYTVRRQTGRSIKQADIARSPTAGPKPGARKYIITNRSEFLIEFRPVYPNRIPKTHKTFNFLNPHFSVNLP